MRTIASTERERTPAPSLGTRRYWTPFLRLSSGGLCLMILNGGCNGTISEQSPPNAPGNGGLGTGGSGTGGSSAGGTAGKGGSGGKVGTGGTPPVGVRPPAGSCRLENPAFCETFDVAGSGVRGTPLNPQRIGVARIGPGGNPPQNQLDPWKPATALWCDGTSKTVSPPNDYFLCPSSPSGNHLRQAYDDGGDFTVHSLAIRQLFDFTGRTGTYAFDVDGWFTPGHGTWLEAWVTDEPIPVPYQGAPGVNALSRNAIGFEFHHDGCSMDATSNGVRTVFIVKNYDVVRTLSSSDFQYSCFKTARTVFNHVEVRVSRTTLEVMATDAGSSNLRRVAYVTGLDLGLERGFVHVQHSHYNAGKDNHPTSETHIWDNFAFDGPAYVPPRTYEIPDSVKSTVEGRINVGYNASSGAVLRFEIPNVDVSNVVSGTLNLSATNFLPENTLKHRFNGGTWRSYPHPFPDSADTWRSLSAPVLPTDLKAGTNVLEITVDKSNFFTSIANIDVQLVPGK